MEPEHTSTRVVEGGTDKTAEGTPQTTSLSRTVQRVVAEGLFGQFDYDLTATDLSANLSKILIFYGDNGSGKTTILRLLFHLLSPSNKRGHRNSLARIPFRKFEVTLADGTRVAISRGDELIGPYAILAEPSGQPAIRGSFGPKDDKKSFSSEEFERDFIVFLQRLDQSFYLLPAERTILSDSLSDRDPASASKNIERDLLLSMNLPHSEEQLSLRLEELRNQMRANALLMAMRIATEWIRNQALKATARGTENANSIYVDIIKRIAASPLFEKSTGAAVHYEQISEILRGLAIRSAEYAKFGFTSPLQIDEIMAVLSDPSVQTTKIIENVLEPYIDVSTARLDALKGLHSLTANLINNLNRFYSGKSVRFSLTEGFKILRSDEQLIEPTWLSSGEQQLFLMFCHVLTCRDKRSVFIIDEPEISLNIKWKRSLITSLLNIAEGGQVQFIFATHSMELISEHLANVVKLQPRPSAKVGQTAEVEEIGATPNS